MQRSSLVAAVLWIGVCAGHARADDAPPPVSDAKPTDDAPPPPLEVEKPIEVEAKPIAMSRESLMVAGVETGSYRSTGEEFLVLPDGLDAGARLRVITADGGLGPSALKFTDLALFDVSAQWAIAKHYELDIALSVLPKQPSATHENVFQGGSLAIRRDVAARTAIAISGSAAPLVGIDGVMFGGALFVTHKHRLNEIVTFALAGGASSTFLRPAGTSERPLIIEGAGSIAVLARVPNGVWGGWMSAGYAVPAYRRGNDPISGMRLDPQPRLDLTIGNAVQLADRWDLSVELSIIDRGDLAAPATRLPILDGGFDQIQLMFGISRRFDLTSHSDRNRGITEPLMQL